MLRPEWSATTAVGSGVGKVRAAMRHWFTGAVWLALAPICAAGSAAAAEMPAIRGTLTVAPDLARHIGPDDRLIIKLYHPKDGVEMDAKYQIVPSCSRRRHRST
jgi:hypothetical protein